MPDDEIEDTATGIGPIPATHPSMEEEFSTSITKAPPAAAEESLEDAPTGVTRSPIDAAAPTEDQPSNSAPATVAAPEAPSEDAPTGIAKAPSRPDAPVTEAHAADDDGPTSISRVALDDDWEGPVTAGAAEPDDDPHEDGPTGVTKVDLPPPDEVPTGRAARPAGIVVPGVRKVGPAAGAPATQPTSPPSSKQPLTQDPEEDSVVTLQKAVPDGKDESIVTIQPSAKHHALAKISPPAKTPTPPKAGSVGKLPAASPPPRQRPAASDIYDVDDDKTERRDIPSEEINRAIARAKMEPVNISELPDESPTARRADLAITPKTGVRSAMPPLAGEEEPSELATETDLGPLVRRSLGDNVVRPPYNSETDSVITEPAIDKESRVPRTTNLMNTSPVPRTTQQGMAPPPPRPPENSLGTDSYTFQGGAGELQAVIPMTAATKVSSGPAAPTSNALMLSAAGAPSTQSMAIQQLPGGYSQPAQPPSSGPHLQAAMTLQSAAMLPTAPAAFPPGLPAGALNGTIQPANGLPSGRMQVAGSFPPPIMGSSPSGLGFADMSNAPRPMEEPRWIVLVLGVLAVCILIPTVLYVVLRSRADDAAAEETPTRANVTIQNVQPRDVGKRGR